jgi:hypothetical protein
MPRGLRHEMSSPVQTLGSQFPIPIEAWISIRVSPALVLSCVGKGFATGLITGPRSPTDCLQDPQFHINSNGNRPDCQMR